MPTTPPREAYRVTRFTEKRSVADTLLETLGQTDLRPTFPKAASRRRARLSQRVVGALMLLASAALGFALLQWLDDAPRVNHVAQLELVHGTVWRDPVWRHPTGTSGGALPASGGNDSSRLLTLTKGEPLRAGAVVETGVAAGGASNRAALRLAGGQSMRLDDNTRIRLASSSSIILERGAVYFDSVGAGLEVRTTLGVVRDIGTQFEVRLSPGGDSGSELRVRVREGSIVLEHEGESHHAILGEELTVDSHGLVERSEIRTYGLHWHWVLDTAPAPDVTGKPLQVFLDWLAREGGWTTHFADSATAEIAKATLLHGDIRGLTPSQASAMVLQGSGLTHRLEESTLVIERAGVVPTSE